MMKRFCVYFFETNRPKTARDHAMKNKHSETAARDEGGAMMRVILLTALLAALLAESGFAQEREMILPVPQSAYSQAVKVKGATLEFISGVGPDDEKDVLAAPGYHAGQAGRTW